MSAKRKLISGLGELSLATVIIIICILMYENKLYYAVYLHG